ncbi:MAG: hypothetical protein M1820_008515 [Bogoriella megaspora]|nr:MAG: hypothetical protein M1820_008515 [Bogoriella megaspora]
MSHHRLPFIRLPTQAPDDEIELLGSTKGKIDTSTAGASDHWSFLSASDLPAQEPRSFADDSDSLQNRRFWRLRLRFGWRFGVVCGCFSATVVLLINLVFTIWASQNQTVAPIATIADSGRVPLFSGSCSKANRIDTAAHLLINTLSTVLLSASNYCMQCLSAPTRSEVDKAHSRKTWADIGVPSVRNLRLIEKRKVILWWLLGLSSLPLHLLYNSAVINSIATWDYNVLLANNTYVQEDLWQQMRSDGNVSVDAIAAHDAFFSEPWPQKLDNEACITTYGQNIQTARGDVVLVYENGLEFNATAASGGLPNGGGLLAINPSGSQTSYTYSRGSVYYPSPRGHFEDEGAGSSEGEEQVSWMCSNWNPPDYGNPKVPLCSSQFSALRANSNNWSPFYQAGVSYCLSKPQPEFCEIDFSLPIAIVVILLNAFKAFIMGVTAFTSKERPLVTVGDGIASFLQREDLATQKLCLKSRNDFHTSQKRQILLSPQPQPQQWTARRTRWFRAASMGRWTSVILLYLIALVVVASLLGYGMSSIDPNPGFGYFWSFGLGAVNTQTMISWEIPSDGVRGVVANTLVANIAQVILSFIYFTYNGLFTCMLLAKEWHDFARERKGLRVSGIPKGRQRSSYFLQLPYRFSLPLMALSGVLHWLVSESIFLVSLNSYLTGSVQSGQIRNVNYFSGSTMTCGFSPPAIFIVILVGIFMVVVIIAFGSFRFQPGIPMASSCSLAIAAACHPGPKNSGVDISASELQWGVIEEPFDEIPGHCGFSDKRVDMPIEGPMYW